VNEDHEAFRLALAKGSGQAMLVLRRIGGDEAIRGALLNGCLRNLAHDPQCESERSAYLARLIDEAGLRADLFPSLIQILESTPDDDVNAPQVFAVLSRLACAHSDLDAAALRRVFAGLTAGDQLDCLDALVRLDGVPALLDCAERLCGNLPEDGWLGEGLFEALRERDGPEVDQKLHVLRAQHRSLDQLMSFVEARQEPQTKPALPVEDYDFPEIRATLRLGKRPTGIRIWALTEDHWAILADDLVARKDDDPVLPYLRWFSYRPFPREPQFLERWTDNPDPQLAWAALRAMSRIKSPFVRNKALQRLEAGDESGVRLLHSNYVAGDLERIKPLFGAPLDHDEAHDLGLAVLILVAENSVTSAERREMLLLVYTCTPCSFCRRDVVSELLETHEVPGWMAEECRFDADPDTVKLFSA